MRYHGRNAVVLGLGITGLSLVRHLVRHGARVRVADTRVDPPNADALRRDFSGVPLETGPLTSRTFEGADLVAISPGVAKDQPSIEQAVSEGAELAGDVELFARALPAGQKVLAITGTNGKTTVTALTGALTRAAGLRTVVAGNIGDAVLDVLARHESGEPFPDVFVLELSSYQLETTDTLAPVAATVLNLSANHMDRYGGLADYAAAKARIFARASVQVLNRDDAIVRLMRLPGRTVQTFGAGVPHSEEEWGVVVRDADAWLARGGELLTSAARLSLVGAHNVQNALAALALASSVANVDARMLAALAAFAPLPHRMEHVGDVGGVRFINDSKGTTVAATQVALDGLGPSPALSGTLAPLAGRGQGEGEPRIVLIAGGDGKGQSFAPLRASVERSCGAVLLIGRDAPLIERALAGLRVPVETVGTLDAAVARALALAQPGDTVLLSPACASLDQFRNYEARGDRFRALVSAHMAEPADA
jgi:UDP-N-acetylmuramoylalanine--D-glutamate ligase